MDRVCREKEKTTTYFARYLGGKMLRGIDVSELSNSEIEDYFEPEEEDNPFNLNEEDYREMNSIREELRRLIR